jgi:hypothetical protein
MTNTTSCCRSLNDRRHEAAQREYETYDFGENEISDQGSWEYLTPGNEWTRPVFFEPNEDDLKEGQALDDLDSVQGHFTVVFAEGSDEIVSAYGSINGFDIGRREPESPSSEMEP